MHFGSLIEKVFAGTIVLIIGAFLTYQLWPKIGSWWRRRRRVLIAAGGHTFRTYVSAGISADGTPDLLVKNQHGELRICLETQPLGQVAFRFVNPSDGGVLATVIVLTADELIDMRDKTGAALLSSATQNDLNKAATPTEAPTLTGVLEHTLDYTCELEVKLFHFQDGFFRLVAAHETWTHCGFALQVIRPLPYRWDKKRAEVVGVSARIVYLEEIEEPAKRKGAKPRIRTQRMCTVYQGAWVGTVGGIQQLGGGDIGYLIVAVSTKTDPVHWYGVETHKSMVIIGHELLLVPTDGTKRVEISFIVDGVDIAQGVLIDVDLSPATRRAEIAGERVK
jgi:hypothetical protein